MVAPRHVAPPLAAALAVVGGLLPAAHADARPAPQPVEAGINLGSGFEEAFAAMTPAQQSQVMSQIAATGARWIRIDVPFFEDEAQPGVFTWQFQSEVTSAVAHGLHVDALLSYAPGWAEDAESQPDPTLTAQFASAAAAHFAPLGVHTWEIWNEPNLSYSWGGPVDPVAYAAVLEAAAHAIKARDPGARILSGGLSRAPDVPGEAMDPVSFLTAVYAAGAGGSFDAVADHPYSYPDDPSADDPSTNGFSLLPALHRVMAANGDGAKKIWITEYGAPTGGPDGVSEDSQAEMLGSAFAIASTYGWVGPLMAFDWQDTDEDGDYGLLDASGAPKPSLAVFSAAASLAAGDRHP